MLSPVIYLMMNGLFFTLRLSGQAKVLEERLAVLQSEAEKGQQTTAQLQGTDWRTVTTASIIACLFWVSWSKI